MSSSQRQVLLTLEDVMNWMAPYAGGSVPDETDDPENYNFWVRAIQLGQQDVANRYFLRRFLIPETITITKDEDEIDLPDGFNKINGIYLLDVGGINWAGPNNEDGQRLWVYMDPTDATWKCKFIGFTPTETVTDAVLWYFYNPPVPTGLDDPLYVDGEMLGYYALKEYHRKQGEFGSMDDARIEYENRVENFTDLEVLPSPQELISWKNVYLYKNQSPNESQFYQGRRHRVR